MLLVSLPLLISYLWSTSGTYQPFLEIIYNTLGFILFLTVGSLALDHYRNYAGGMTPNTNDNMRGDTTANKWLGTTNSTWADSSIGRALGLNNTDNVNAGKALGVYNLQQFLVKILLTHFCNNFSFLVSMYHQRFLLFDRCCLGPATRIDRVNEIVFPLHLRGIGVTYTTLNIPEILCFLIGLFLIKCRNFCSFVFFRFNIIISDLIAIFVLPFVFFI